MLTLQSTGSRRRSVPRDPRSLCQILMGGDLRVQSSAPRLCVSLGSAFCPSPRQASSWRWRQLPPRGDASPPWAGGRPAAGPRVSASRDPPPAPNAEARGPRVISARRKLRADFLPRGSAVPAFLRWRVGRSPEKPREAPRSPAKPALCLRRAPRPRGRPHPRVLARLPPPAPPPLSSGSQPALAAACYRPGADTAPKLPNGA